MNRQQRRANQAMSASRPSKEPTLDEIRLVVSLFNQGRFVDAEAIARKITASFKDFGFGWKCLGTLLKSQCRPEESLDALEKAARLLPDDYEVHSNLGVAYKDLNRMKEAEVCFHRALAVKPDFAEAYNNLGVLYKEIGRLDEAETCYRRALEIKPRIADVYSNLGAVLNDLGRLHESAACHYQALAINPGFAKGHNNLGSTLNALGRMEEAEPCFRMALELKPDYAETHSNLLFNLNYIANRHPLSLLAEARRYGEMITSKVGQRYSSWTCIRQPDRLRVGLVSGDLINHPVGFFLESVLAQIDQSRIELIAYSTNFKEDELTDRIKPYFSAWKSLVGLSDESAAKLIHSDGIHLLLDLSGHTAKNRLPVFAWKPAPVQATWLGYLATTGLAEIDYLIGDPQATPPENNGHFSETVWRLPDVWGCFTPPKIVQEVKPLPALSAGCITFGCFNNLSKMNAAVVALWSRVLKAVPDSRLYLKTNRLDDRSVCDATLQRFAEHGIEPGRLMLAGSSPRAEHLAAYNRVDIALDPFPYGGGTTTYEILWMAVPVITCKGNLFLSRCGQSLAFNAGLSDWIADDDDDYVAKAIEHTQDLKKLAILRDGLRQQVLDSPIFDAQLFARNLEKALWGMWERYQKN